MVINGVDYTLYIVAAVSVLVIGGLEYYICKKSTKRSNRQALLFIPFFILTGAVVVFGSENGGGFLDPRGAVVTMMVIWALLCAVAQFVGWFVFKLKYESKNDDIPRDCPMSKE